MCIKYAARAGFQDVPCAVLVAHSVLNGAADSPGARLSSRFFDEMAVVGVNLIERRCALEVFGCVAENPLVSGAVVETFSVPINDRNHVSCILADQAEQLLATN